MASYLLWRELDTRGTVVHHVNHDNRDDRPANLTVMSRAVHNCHHKQQLAEDLPLRLVWARLRAPRKPAGAGPSPACSRHCARMLTRRRKAPCDLAPLPAPRASGRSGAVGPQLALPGLRGDLRLRRGQRLEVPVHPRGPPVSRASRLPVAPGPVTAAAAGDPARAAEQQVPRHAGLPARGPAALLGALVLRVPPLGTRPPTLRSRAVATSRRLRRPGSSPPGGSLPCGGPQPHDAVRTFVTILRLLWCALVFLAWAPALDPRLRSRPDLGCLGACESALRLAGRDMAGRRFRITHSSG